MKKNISEIDPIKTKEVLEILNCCRTTFVKNFQPSLTKYYEQGQTHFCYYDKEKVLELAKINIDKANDKKVKLELPEANSPATVDIDVKLINARWHVNGKPFAKLSPIEITILDCFVTDYRNHAV